MGEQTPETEFRSDMVVTRVLDAPVEEVWRYWTDPDRFARWWGPQGFGVAKAEMDVRVGGKYLWCMRPAAGYEGHNPCNAGTLTEVVPHKLLRYVTQWSDDQGKVLTAAEAGMPTMPDDFAETVKFEALPDGRTIMTYTEHDLPVNLMFAYSWVGMWQSLDKMEAALRAERG